MKRCSCCGKRKGLFESFEKLTDKVSICVECSKRLYKYQDYRKEDNSEECQRVIKEIVCDKNSKAFTKWFEGFLKRIDRRLSDDVVGDNSEALPK